MRSKEQLPWLFTHRWSHCLPASCSFWVSRAAHTTWGPLIPPHWCGNRCLLLSKTATQGTPISMTPCKTKYHVTHKWESDIPLCLLDCIRRKYNYVHLQEILWDRLPGVRFFNYFCFFCSSIIVVLWHLMDNACLDLLICLDSYLLHGRISLKM